MQKNFIICLGSLLLAAGFTAYSIENSRKSLSVPESAVKEKPGIQAKKLGQFKSVSLRAPGEAYSIPFSFQPTEDQYGECTIIDNNQDGTNWVYATDEGGSFRYGWNSQNEADDWCILPPVQMEAGNYKVTYTYKTKSDKERFKMFLGKGSDINTYNILIMEKTDYSNMIPVQESAVVKVEEAGEWNVGLYACSEKNKYGIYISGISIERLDDNQPQVPTVAVSSYGMEATVEVTLPETTFGGSPLASDITANVYLDNNEEPVASATGAPGETLSVKFDSPESGLHNITVRATTEIDGKTYVSEPVIVSHRFTKIQPVPLPINYQIIPDEDEFSWCTVINSNGDNREWEYCSTGFPSDGQTTDGAFRYSYSWTDAADDWIILPAFDGSVGGAYKLEFNVGTKYNNEGLEVCMAYEPTVEALSQNVIFSDSKIKTDDSFERRDADFTVQEGRNFYIAFHCVSPNNAAYLYLQDIVVTRTNDLIPLSASLSDALFDGGDGTVKLTLPDKNIGGNAIEFAKVYADITLDGQPYGQPAEGAPGEMVDLQFSGLALGNHAVTATSYLFDNEGNRLEGRPVSLSFKVGLNSSFSYSLPLDLQITEDNADILLVVDANDDGNSWFYENGYKYKYHSTNSGDDWFFTPAISVEDASKLYDVTVHAKSQSSSYEEEFEVFIGKERSVEGMTIPVLGRTGTNQTELTPFTATVQLPEAGRYYIGVHAVSKPNLYYLYVNRIEMAESAVSTDTPAVVSDLVAEGAETGELKAVVSFKFPTTDLAGNELDAAAELTATVTSSTETKTVTGTPGLPASVEIACPAGNSEISVVVANAAGTGASTKVNVNCGLDKPMAPEITKLTIGEDNCSITIEYAPVTKGVNGGHVNASGIDYYLWEWDEEDEDWYQIDVTDALSMVYELYYKDAPQSYIQLGLQAYNGLNSGSNITPFSVVLGKPYELPMEENFANAATHYEPIMVSSSYDSEYAPQWGLVKPEQVIGSVTSPDGEYSLYGHTTYNMGDSFIAIPKFSTVDVVNPAFEFVYYMYPQSCDVTLLGAAYGMENFVEIGKVERPQTTAGWSTFQFALPEELLNQKWVDLRVHVDFVGGSSSVPLIDSYKIASSSVVGVDNALSAGRSVSGLDGEILLKGFNAEKVSVCNVSGQLIYTGVMNSDAEKVSAESGVYLVKAAGSTFKVIVR